MKTTLIDSVLYRNMIRSGAQNLSVNRKEVNDLNVFPIPDGDTGDNMFMTIDAAASKIEDGENLSETAAAAASDMLLGARGNSGVILSRIFAGIGKGLSGVEKADVPAFTKALRHGVKESYGAVASPVEGTILTVYREAVEHVERLEPGDFETLFDEFILELNRSLEKTPEKLDVLRDAGVVDSGGAGFIYIAEGMKAALSGIEFEVQSGAGASAKKVDIGAFTEDSVLEFGYCTEFLLRLQRSKIDVDNFDLDELVSWLNENGDSVVAFQEGTVVKVHVHTKTPGDILNHMQRYGEFLTTKIENMTLQHNEHHKSREEKDRFKSKVKKPKKPYGIVTVAAGEGIREIFLSLGVDAVVDGGQSMNPSAEDLLAAFEKANAETVFVFPNNSNIILAAAQAAKLFEGSDIRVMKTKTVGEGYAAISMFDTTLGGADEIEENLNEVISGVVTGLVSVAVRDTELDGVKVHEGDYIGFVNDTVYVDEKNRADALLGLAEKLNASRYDIMLVLCGADATPEDSDRIYAELRTRCRRTEVIMLDGGQPVYDYIMILE